MPGNLLRDQVLAAAGATHTDGGLPRGRIPPRVLPPGRPVPALQPRGGGWLGANSRRVRADCGAGAGWQLQVRTAPCTSHPPRVRACRTEHATTNLA